MILLLLLYFIYTTIINTCWDYTITTEYTRCIIVIIQCSRMKNVYRETADWNSTVLRLYLEYSREMGTNNMVLLEVDDPS